MRSAEEASLFIRNTNNVFKSYRKLTKIYGFRNSLDFVLFQCYTVRDKNQNLRKEPGFMVRRRKSVFWLAIVCTVFLAAGCGSKEAAESRTSVFPEPEAEAPVMEEKKEIIKEETIEETESAETQSSEAGPGAGLPDTEEKKDGQEKIEAFGERLQEAVSDRDLESLADLTAYPLTVKMADGEILMITDRQELLKQNPDLIFGDDFLMAIANVDTATLVETKDGVVMGEEGPGLVFRETGTDSFGVVSIQE